MAGMDVGSGAQRHYSNQVGGSGDVAVADIDKLFDNENGTRCLWNRRCREVQAHLQRRVAGILTQIRCTSSANHFDRHRVEIDELLRCDAPMGFTPSMILSGVPDIIHLLTEAVRDRRVTESGGDNHPSMTALTPIRRSSKYLATSNPLFVKEVVSSTLREGGKCKAQLVYHSPNVANPLEPGGGKSEDITSFLPPLVRHARTSALTEHNRTSDAFATRECKRPSAKSGKSVEVFAATGLSTAKRGARDGSNTPVDKSATSLPRTDTSRQPINRQVSGTELGNQQQQEADGFTSRCTSCDAADPKNVAVLRDIPSTIVAMMYHCAFPLVCITPEDYETRASATHLLVTTLSSIIRRTWGEADCAEYDQFSTEDDTVNQSTSNESKMGSSVHVGEHSSGQLVANNEKKRSIRHGDVLYQLRRAALYTLHAILAIMESENSSLVNKHFAARDQQLYCMFGDVNFSMDCLVMDRRSCAEEERDTDCDRVDKTNVRIPSAGTTGSPGPSSCCQRLSVTCLRAMQKTQKKMLVRRVAPLSIYNNVVDVNVLIPLLERWACILERNAQNNSVLDSARFLIRYPDIQKTCQRSDLMAKKKLGMAAVTICGEEGRSSVPPDVDAGEKAEKKGEEGAADDVIPMYERDVEEIYLLLRISLQLSPYKHHVNFSSRLGDCLAFAGGRPPQSIPVLVCLTMSRCMDGDKHLPVCVECLWNLLDVIPEEATREILHHTVEEGNVHTQSTEKQDGILSNRPPLSRLSASQALLHCFLQFLVSGHRLEYRELRNDIVVLMLIILRTHTTRLKQQEETLLYNTEAEQPPLLPAATVKAVTTMAKTVFDLVCGPELQVFGTTAELTLESPELFRRHHTVLSPTTRKENLQFKVLGWRFLEAFHEWQNVRLALELRCRPRVSRTTLNSRAPASQGYVFDAGNVVFDVCGAGFIDLLLMYVDTDCSNELVLSWSREDLLTLQEESWGVILAMVEPPARPSVTKAFEGISGGGSWRGAEDSEVMGDKLSGGMWTEGVGDEWPLLRADVAFVGANGIACAMRYIQETYSDDTEVMGCLAVHVLSVLSRFPCHRQALLAMHVAAPTTTQLVPLLFVIILHLVQRLFARVENNASGTKNSGAVVGATASEGISKPQSMRHTEKDGTISSDNYESGAWGQKEPQGRKRYPRASQGAQVLTAQKDCSQVGVSRAVASSAQRTCTAPKHSNKCAYFPVQITNVFLKCLSLLHNVADGSGDEVAATQRAFIAMDGISHTLRLVWSSLTPSASPSGFPRFRVEERNTELLAATLNCLRVFLTGNAAGQVQFVRNDGVNTLLTVIEAYLGKECQQSSHIMGGNFPLALHLTLTLFADLLRENEGARDAFLRWFSYTSQDVEKADDGRVNAVQLLLRLWTEDTVNGGIQDIGPRADSAGNVSSATTTLRRDSRTRKRDFDCLKISTSSTMLTKVADDDIENYSVGRQTTMMELCPGAWGLSSLGLQSRELVAAALWRRYADLEHMDRFNTDVNMAGRSGTLKGFREQLSGPICKVLGLRVGVYACLAAVGFEYVARVKATPQERVKLLHIAALETMCRDEVWGAIAESVDLGDRVLVRGEKKSVSSAMGSFCGSRRRSSVVFKNPTQLVPIVPDADKLVKVLADVDSRAREMKRFETVTLDMQGVHDVEDVNRALLAFVRHDNDSSACTLAEQQCKGEKRRFVVARGMSSPSIAPTLSEGGDAANEFVTVHPYPTLSENNIPTVTTGSWPLCPSGSMGFLEKKRKKEAMIQNSFKGSKALHVKEPLAFTRLM